MVKVPEYTQDVALRPAFRQSVDVQATPEAFGASVGKGIADVGKGVDNAVDNLRAVQALDATLLTKDRENKLSDWTRERMHGRGGYMTLEGQSAVNGRDAFQQDFEAKRKELGEGLTGEAARQYQVASDARRQTVFSQAIVHQAQGRRQWSNDTSEARVKTFANDALANFANPQLIEKNIALGVAELRSTGELHGWSKETLEGKEREYQSGVLKNVATRMAETDPIAADKFRAQNVSRLSGSDAYELGHALKLPLREAQSKRAASDFLSQNSSVSDASAFGMISKFEGFRSSTYWDVNHDRVGYGSDTVTREDGTVMTVQKGMTVTAADAARDLNRRIGQYQTKIVQAVGDDKWNALPMAARSAVTSVAYNYGSLPESVTTAIRTGGPAEIATAIKGLAGHNDGVNSRRRNEEANAVLGLPAGKGAQDLLTNMESYLATIKDPDVQDMTRKRINAMIETQHKVSVETQRAGKATLWNYIDQGKTPDQVPMEVRQAAGMEAVSSAWSYLETVRNGRDAKDDDVLAYDMRRFAAEKPEEFAAIDLNDYRGKLSRNTIKEMTGLQSSALTDQRKAKAEGLNLTTAFSQATQQLEAVGITATGKKGSQLEAANKRIASFNNSLSNEMDEFKRANADKQPTQADIQKMVNKLLLPIAIKTPGMIWNSTDTSKRLFEAGSRADNATVDVTVKYSEIPIDLRRGITTDLTRTLGRKPSEAEVTSRYEDFVLSK